LLKQGASAAVKKAKAIKPLEVSKPVTIRLQFKESGSAESAARVPGAKLLSDDTVMLECPNMEQAYAAYSSLVELWQEAWGAWQRG
jgi:D-aminopeptidase